MISFATRYRMSSSAKLWNTLPARGSGLPRCGPCRSLGGGRRLWKAGVDPEESGWMGARGQCGGAGVQVVLGVQVLLGVQVVQGVQGLGKLPLWEGSERSDCHSGSSAWTSGRSCKTAPVKATWDDFSRDMSLFCKSISPPDGRLGKEFCPSEKKYWYKGTTG